MTAALALCLVVSVHDGDTFTCAGGRRIRIAAIQAPDFEESSPCRQRRFGYDCDDGRAIKSRDFLTGILRGRRITYHSTGTSYNRTVAKVYANGIDVGEIMVRYRFARRWP